MLGMGTSRRLHLFATLFERLPRVPLPFLPRSRLCLLATLVLISSFAAASASDSDIDSGSYFTYPEGGESFYNLDYVNVTYKSTFTSPTLYTFCSIDSVTQRMQVQDAEPDNASALIHLNVTTNVPCWFELSSSQVAGEQATSGKWTVFARVRQQSTWSATAEATSTPTSNTVTMASTTSDQVTERTSQNEHSDGLSSGAKVGIAIAVAFGTVAVFSTALWLWWRRHQKREVAKDMVNFVDGDIVNLMDRGRFEKRTKPPDEYYDPYLGASSQSTISPSTYTSASTYHSAPPAEQQQYYAPPPPPLVRQPIPPSIQPQTVLPPATTNDNAAWSNTGRHPWSPPDYEAHSPASGWHDQAERDPYAAVRRSYSSTDREWKETQPVEALPAILPDLKPQAELPAREYYGHGDEQELPVPQQAPPSRHAPPNGLEIEEQKFLLADMIALRQTRSRPGGSGPAG